MRLKSGQSAEIFKCSKEKTSIVKYLKFRLLKCKATKIRVLEYWFQRANSWEWKNGRHISITAVFCGRTAKKIFCIFCANLKPRINSASSDIVRTPNVYISVIKSKVQPCIYNRRRSRTAPITSYILLPQNPVTDFILRQEWKSKR